jgi:hypothetical protein
MQQLVPEHSSFEAVTATGEVESYKSPRQIPTDLIQGECNTVRCEINKLIKEYLPEQWNRRNVVIKLRIVRRLQLSGM